MFALVLIVWRFSFVLLLAAVMLGQTFGEMLVVAAVIVAVAAWRSARSGKPF